MGSVATLQKGHHALVFGSSGILGWAVVNEILNNYPDKGAYRKVTALTHRPLSLKDSLWEPRPENGGAELSIVNGIDLTKGTVKDHIEILRKLVPDIDSVTHVYWFAYKFDADFRTESQINVDMLKRGLGAAEALALKLQYVILPTGTKGYGIFLPEIPFETPFSEEVCDQPQPWHDTLFYYVLHHELDRMQKGKSWRFAEVRCAVVVGFTPHSNVYNLWAAYIRFCSMYKYMHDKGHPAAKSKEVPFPELPVAWAGTYNDGGQDIFAKFSIHLCLNPDVAGNSELYNIANERESHSLAERWPTVAEHFGLVGLPPVEPSHPEHRRTDAWMVEHADVLDAMLKETGIDLPSMDYDYAGDFLCGTLAITHDLCLNKARSTGFVEEESFSSSFHNCFERYNKAGRVYIGSRA